ncbi:MAG: sodium:calcium antiporter [Anaerolineaceae bacterium]|nr:sodium:calcium antiporter [Anaerolineaceae bacterium]
MILVWLKFAFSAAILVVAAIKLAEYGDVIAVRTKISGMFIGLILLAGATSLPEFLTTINSISIGEPDLAAGNMFGSNMVNMLLLGLTDLMSRTTRVLRKVAHRHALSGAISVFLIGLATFFIMADIETKIGWVGIDSLIILSAYIIGMRIIQHSANPAPVRDDQPISSDFPSLKKGIIGFSIATLALVLIMPLLVSTSNEIATLTGLGTGFIGTALVALITSLPELVTTITAIRLGVFDLAIGNLFGSNMFNIFSLALADFFMTEGRFLGTISQDFVMVGLIGLIMTGMALIGNLAKIERKIFFIEIDAVLLIIVYFLGMFLIFSKGIGV